MYVMVYGIVNILRRNVLVPFDHCPDLSGDLRPCELIMALLVCRNDMDTLAVIADIRLFRSGMSASPVFLAQHRRKLRVIRLILVIEIRNAQLAVDKLRAACKVIAQKLHLFIGDGVRLHFRSIGKQAQLSFACGHRKTAVRFGQRFLRCNCIVCFSYAVASVGTVGGTRIRSRITVLSV